MFAIRCAVPTGFWLRLYGTRLQLVVLVMGALFLLCAIALPLYHAAHRIYHGLHDLHLKAPNGVMLAVCYGTATMLSLLALFCLTVLVLKG